MGSESYSQNGAEQFALDESFLIEPDIAEFEGAPIPDKFVARAPHPVLRPLITRYIGYRQHDVPLRLHRGLPSRHVTLIISLADPVRIVGMPNDHASACLGELIGGLHVAPALIAQDRYQCGLHLELNPLGVRALLGMPAAELSGSVVDLRELGRPELTWLRERLMLAVSWRHRFAILDEVFLHISEERTPPREVTWAWRRMVASGGLLPVRTLAGEVGWSRRHFAERFRREVGLTPKQAARVVRFERACAALRHTPGRGLSELAADCGYYDHAHLTNEWRALAGCTPSRWIAEELPFLQDGTDPDWSESTA